MDLHHAREFADKGYTVARGFFSLEEVALLRAEAERRMADPDTFDPLSENGLIFTQNVYRGSEAFRQFLSQQRIIDFLTPIAGGNLWLRWDQAVTKRPGGGVFRWHQDNGYNGLPTQHFQLWIALTPTREQNGALWLAPGSHKRGLLPHRNVPGEHQVELIGDVGETVCVDATEGDLILFSSLMLHSTGPNQAETARVAYVAEYMPLDDYDFQGKGPYFIVSKNGQSDPHFVRIQPGALSLRNQLKALPPRAYGFKFKAQRAAKSWKKHIRTLSGRA